MRKNWYTLLLVIILTLCSCSCSFLSNQNKETTSNSTTCITKKIYVEVENMDHKNEGRINAHEKDAFYHKLILDFANENIDDIKVGDILEVNYSETIKTNPERFIVVKYRKLN